jgi:adenosylcobinamide-phosphate guanylyltransferase
VDALLMCGGRGTRLDAAVEKPLYEIGGRPMLDRVLDALVDSRIETVYAVGSLHAPRTRERLERLGDDERFACRFIDAPGGGYVADLRYALERVDPPVLTVAADLPLLAGDAVDAVLDGYAGGSLTVCVPVALKRLLGASIGSAAERDGRAVAPTGVNIVSRGTDGTAEDTEPTETTEITETTYMTYDARFAVNVNRPSDARLAEDLL